MTCHRSRQIFNFALFAIALTPMLIATARDQDPAPEKKPEPTSEQVFKDIRAFKGVPASDLIPAMEFMSASLKYHCTDCHDAQDYAKETKKKETTRTMVLLQREINAKYFNGKLEVTCMSCHNGLEHPVAVPLPPAVKLRHERFESPVTAKELLAKHVAAAGIDPAVLVRTGELTAPSDDGKKIETKPVELIQAQGGKFRFSSGDRLVRSDGKSVSYGEAEMFGEPAAIFGRLGRAWRGPDAFAGYERVIISGRETVGMTVMTVVRGTRPSTSSTEELYLDPKSGLLAQMVNSRPSTVGTVVSMIEYGDYKGVGGAKVPMKIVLTFAGGEQWSMRFKAAKTEAKADDSMFRVGG